MGGGYNIAGEGKFSFAPTKSVCVGGGGNVLAMLTKRVEVVLTQELEVVAILKGAQKVLEPQFPHFVIPLPIINDRSLNGFYGPSEVGSFLLQNSSLVKKHCIIIA